MDIYEFIWDARVAEKIVTKHHVLPEEVEQIFQGKTSIRSHRGVYVALGQTLDGRLLLVVLTRKSRGALRIITAREMTTGEKRLYKKTI